MTKSERTRLTNLLAKRRFVQLTSAELKILARLEAKMEGLQYRQRNSRFRNGNGNGREIGI
jgi:hypothetical protein